MCDFARQRSFVRKEFLLWLDALSRLGYNGVGLYLEGAFEFDSIPGVIREGVMTKADAAWAVEESKKRGILVFPMTNVVGHMEHFFRQERYRDLLMANTDGRQMNFFDPRAEEFVMGVVHEYAAAFGTGMVHIGGDETTLKPEEKVPYAQFLAKICRNLLDEGITPAIWDDMIWMDLPLCEYFDRRTVIFDWNYYGHRPESPKYFKDLGFRDVIVCPCDNSWEGFICCQRISGYLKSNRDILVKPNEVEAFFEDAKNADVLAGMLTNWENTLGRNMWGQWAAFARGGLYMSGRLEAREENDALIEQVLFGRETPYSAVTHLLQDRLPYDRNFSTMRGALFLPANLVKLYEILEKGKPITTVDLTDVANEALQMLAAWTPEGDFEQLCANAMYAICDMMKAADAVRRAIEGREKYHRSAELQFEAPEEAQKLLDEVATAFLSAAELVRAYAMTHERAIALTGHTVTDLVLLKETCERLEKIASIISGEKDTLDRIPITGFERILNRAVTKEYIFT